MKAIRNKKIWKGLLSAVLASAMVLNYGPLQHHAHAETPDGTNTDASLESVLDGDGSQTDTVLGDLIDYVGGVTVDAEKGFTDVSGNMIFSADSIEGPIERVTSEGSQFVPSDYVYLGKNNKGPILWRVLDTDLGTSGSDLLLLSEYLMSVTEAGGNYDELYLDYFSDAEKALLVAGEGESALFALNADQVVQYLATYTGAPLRAYTDATRGTSGNWWLASSDSAVLPYVSLSGTIDSADSAARYYNRVALQISREDVVYASRLDGGWRLALLDPDYQALGQTTVTNTLPDWNSGKEYSDQYIPKQYDFSAWVTNIDGTKLEVSYLNAKPSDTDDGMGEYISAVITDANGNIKYYSQLKELTHTAADFQVAYNESGVRLTPWKDTPEYDYQGSVSFDVAGLYDGTAGDKIYVFWEKVHDSLEAETNPALACETSFASRPVELCVHDEDENNPATCVAKTRCSVCEMGYGDYEYVDLDAHVDAEGVSGLVWTQTLGQYRNEDGFVQEGYTHSAVCQYCQLNLPISADGGYAGAVPCFTTTNPELVTCTTPGICDVCLEEFTLPLNHHFSDQDHGVCNNGEHFQEPELEGTSYLIENVGNLIWYQQYTNREEFVNSAKIMYGAKLMADIDFGVLAELGETFADYSWTPIGANSGGEYHATFDGNGHTISNLNCVSDQYLNVALIGSAGQRGESVPTVKNLGIIDGNFQNTYVDPEGNLLSRTAAIVGYARDAVNVDHCYVENTTLKDQNFVGGLVCVVSGGSTITNCAAINLKITLNDVPSSNWIAFNCGSSKPQYCFAYGEGAGIFNGDATGNHSYYLVTEGGTEDVNDPKKTAEQFASGMVAYYLYNADAGYLHSQKLGTDADAYPVLNYSIKPDEGGNVITYPVYQVEICDKDQPDTYTYSNTDTIQHESDGTYVCGDYLVCGNCEQTYGDRLEHSFTKADVTKNFIWNEERTACKLQTYCIHCDEANPTLINANVTVNYNGGIRADYMATAVVGEIIFTSKVIRIPVVEIQDSIGIEASSIIFDGEEHVAKDLVTNTRMQSDEFDAYFILDGDKGTTMESVRDAGVYDLYIVGKGNYAYQEYVYPALFTIEKAVVTMTVSIPDRIVDGTTDFDFKLSFSGNVDYSDLIGIDADQFELPLAEVGEYEITGIRYYCYYEDEANLEITHNETAIARILPRNYVEVINKDYALAYTYTGSALPAPTAANFTADEGSELTFAWFKGDVLLKTAPVNAGRYTLVVYATATDEYIASETAFDVVINPAKVTLGYNLEGLTTVEYDNQTWYVVPFGQKLEPIVTGLVGGDTVESAQLELIEYVYDGRSPSKEFPGEFPTIPNPDNYQIQLALSGSSNYEAENEYSPFYFIIQSPEQMVMPVTKTYDYNGTNQGVDLLLSWDVLELPEVPSDWGSIKYLKYYIQPRQTWGGTDGVFDYENQEQYGDSIDGAHSGYSLKEHTPCYVLNVGTAQTFYVTVSGEVKYYPGETSTEQSYWVDLRFARITVEIKNEAGTSVFSMVDSGTYTVTVTVQELTSEGVSDGSDPVVTSATVTILPEKTPLWLIPMETEMNLDGEAPKYDPSKIVSVPGYSLRPGHTIVDMTFDVNADYGSIGVIACKIVDAQGNDVSHLYLINDGYNNLADWYKEYAKAYGNDPDYQYPDTYWTHQPGYHGMLHVYSNACDTTCNLSGCTTTRTVAPHSGGTATCSSQAICDTCGQKYGGPNPINHADDKVICVQNQTRFDLHDKVWACCGAVLETEEHTLTATPTCTDLAVCEHCGIVGGSYDLSNHTSEGTHYRQNPLDATKHDLVHDCCGTVQLTETHTGGMATCTDLAICEICNLAYGELDSENHASEELLYEATPYNTVKHDVMHACCRALIRTETHSGGTATCTAKAECQHCGNAYGMLNPENHASEEIRYSPATIGNIHYMFHNCCGAAMGSEEHSGGEAVCNAKAQCEHCGIHYGEKAPENHASDEILYRLNSEDHEKHDKYTACCEQFIATEAHSGGTATCRRYAECEHCGEGYGEKLEHQYDTPCDVLCKVCYLARLPEHFDLNGDKVCDGCGRDCSGSRQAVQTTLTKREEE